MDLSLLIIVIYYSFVPFNGYEKSHNYFQFIQMCSYIFFLKNLYSVQLIVLFYNAFHLNEFLDAVIYGKWVKRFLKFSRSNKSPLMISEVLEE